MCGKGHGRSGTMLTSVNRVERPDTRAMRAEHRLITSRYAMWIRNIYGLSSTSKWIAKADLQRLCVGGTTIIQNYHRVNECHFGFFLCSIKVHFWRAFYRQGRDGWFLHRLLQHCRGMISRQGNIFLRVIPDREVVVVGESGAQDGAELPKLIHGQLGVFQHRCLPGFLDRRVIVRRGRTAILLEDDSFVVCCSHFVVLQYPRRAPGFIISPR